MLGVRPGQGSKGGWLGTRTNGPWYSQISHLVRTFHPLHVNARFIPVAFLALSATESAAQCCDHILQMSDTYGDGWNGGAVEVLVNGNSIGTFAAEGTGSSATFTVCNGDALALIYTPQDWEEENRYVLYDQWGNIIFADGPTPATGEVFTGVGDCSLVPVPGGVPCTALPIDTSACATADNTAALGTGIDPGCANYTGADVWYKMPVPTSGNVVVSTVDAGGLEDTGIALWVGPNCFERNLVGCDDDGGPDFFSQLFANELPVGDTLWIQAYGYNGGTGIFDVCVVDPGTVRLDSSEVPIVLIHTLGQVIPDEPKIDARMEIKYNGPGSITRITDPSNVYDGRIGIEIRGATSAGYPQRPYAVETRDTLGNDLDVSLLGMPAESDWVLLSNYNDRSFIRNEIAFKLSASMGQYAPRTHLCEVLVDSVYRGIYVFGERIKRGAGRLDIAKLNADENSGDDLTGGYMLKQDLWNADNSFQSNFSPIDHPGFDVHFIYEYPDPDTITLAQRNYIASYVDSLETALYSAAFADPLIGYRKHLDTKSFIDYFLVNELARSNDGFKKSVYFHKDKNSNGGKLKAGPVWDFDWAWKDLATCDLFDNTDGSGWAHLINDCPTDNYSCGWYVRLLQDSTFTTELRCTYEEYRSSILDTAAIFHLIDSIGDRVAFAQARHFQKWPILGISGPAPEVNPVATTYAAELDTLKAWVTRRLTWMDANLPGLCTNVGVPEQHTSALRATTDASSGHLRLIGPDLGQGRRYVVVQDLLGRHVARYPIPPGPIDVLCPVPSPGAYLFAIWDARGLVEAGKWVAP